MKIKKIFENGFAVEASIKLYQNCTKIVVLKKEG